MKLLLAMLFAGTIGSVVVGNLMHVLATVQEQLAAAGL